MNEKIADKCVNKAINLYHKEQKQISYKHRLTRRQRLLVHLDPEIAELSMQIKDIEKSIVARINELVREDELKTDAEKNKEDKEYVLRQKEEVGVAK